MRVKKIGIMSAGIVLAFVGVSSAQAPGDAFMLIKRVSEAYRNFKSCHFEGVVTAKTQSGSVLHVLETPFVVAVLKPSRLRVETGNSLAAMLIVSDGETTWNYMPRLHEYTKAPTKLFGALAAKDSESSTGHNLLSRFEHLADQTTAVKILQDDRVDIGGKNVDCVIVELVMTGENSPAVEASPHKFWIDKARYLVVRDEQTFKIRRPYTSPAEKTQTTVFTVATMDEPVAESFFKFVPPPDAAQVAELTLRSSNKILLGEGHGPRSRVSTSNVPLVNGARREQSNEASDGNDQPIMVRQPAAANEAADFRLADLDGSEFQLLRLRGKVVMLDFWASWCGPCRRELPLIEKLHREYRRSGLVVLGINDERPDVARSFVNENGYTFSTLSDLRHEAHRLYGVTAIPTLYFIDKNGRITARYVGGRGEQELRVALKQAGLE
ncbi:MAG TPA: redoxin domain-containing protein [Acidobacteriota bacterium]|jgi:thiol-disulfide isomerase/thioredoxin/outer membrane lipoprotein-sorting protein|nr:redoxin domain-containing protein [Acidobacteriota bacterium]